tara:strand:- start:278 stop:523 length:246 start_codon:yes stop_codon:yes gene_type:complete
VPDKFKPGDLIRLNQYGLFITFDHEKKIGLVISESYSIIAPTGDEADTFYTVYDILLEGELFKMVPQEFMENYEGHEENTK